MAKTAFGDENVLTTIPEGPLGTVVPEESQSEGDMNMDDDGIKPADDSQHEGHAHHDHDHMLTEKCLLKSEAIGSMTEGEDMMFDQTQFITMNMMSDHMPWEYYVCIDSSTNQLMALSLSFADAEGEEKIELPLIGQNIYEDLLCGDFKFMDRGPPVSVIMFEQDMYVNGLAITYEDNENGLVKVGTTAPERVEIDFEENQVVAGFYGSVNGDQRITSLGVIIQDTACTQREIEEMMAREKLNLTDDKVSDEDEGGAGLVIGIVIVVLLVIALLVVGLVFYLRKRSKRN